MSAEVGFESRNIIDCRFALRDILGGLLLLKSGDQWQFAGSKITPTPGLDAHISLGNLPELVRDNAFCAALCAIVGNKTRAETGLDNVHVGPPLELVEQRQITSGGLPIGIYATLCAPGYGEGEVRLDRTKYDDFVWAPFADALAHNLEPLTRRAAEKLEPYLAP